jgi:hypothetical protein
LRVGEIIVILHFAIVKQAFASVSRTGLAFCGKVCWLSSIDIVRFLGPFAFSPVEAHLDQYSPVSANDVTIREAAFRLKRVKFSTKPLAVKNMAVVKHGSLNEQQ